jgi:hypothetical protein
MVGDKFRLGHTKFAFPGGRMDYYEGGFLPAEPSIFDEEAQMVGAEDTGVLRNAIEEANRVRRMTAEELGIDAGAMNRMGSAALNAVMERYADPQSAERYRRLSGRKLNTASRDRLAMKRIQLLRKSDAEINRRFAALDGDRNKEIALLAAIEKESGIAETTLASGAGPAGVGVDDIEYSMEEIREWREGALGTLSRLRTGEERTIGGGGGGRTGVGGGILGMTGTGTTVQETLNLNPETVRGLMEIEEVRNNFRTWRFGTADDKRYALNRLRRMATTKGNELSQSQREALQKITATQGKEGDKTSGQLAFAIGRYFKATSSEGRLAIKLREQELGRDLQESLKRSHADFARAGREEAFSQLRRISQLRREGSQESIEQAYELERQFYSKHSQDEDIQDILSRTPGMEYLAAGAGATARLAETLTRPGKEGRVQRLLETSLRAAGLGDLGLTQTEMKRLSDMTKAGEGDVAYTFLEERARKKGKEYLQKLEDRQKLIRESITIGMDDVTDQEAADFASRAGAGAAAKLRAEKGGVDKTATSALQEKMLWTMKKQMLVEMEIARGVGRVDEKLHAALVKGVYGEGEG